MRFIGGKLLLLPSILEMIRENTDGVKHISDLFSGSGIVTRSLMEEGYSTTSNDLMYFSYVLLRGSVSVPKPPKFDGLRKVGIIDPLRHLNEELDASFAINGDEHFFIRNHYSPIGGRMYFTESNALQIDLIRLAIEEWRRQELITEDEYFYLLCSLIEAVPFVSNTSGVYGAYLKHWDPRAHKKLWLEPHRVGNGLTRHTLFNGDALEVASKVSVDLAYYDPPYNQRQYLPNYHILETIAMYDYPEIKGVTGLRGYEEQKSKFCSRTTVYEEARALIERTQARYILLSYNSEGLLSHEEIKKNTALEWK